MPTNLIGQQIELLDYLAAVNAQRRVIFDLNAAVRQARLVHAHVQHGVVGVHVQVRVVLGQLHERV